MLPPDVTQLVVARLDVASRAAAACSCRALRDAAAAVRCDNGVVVHERNLDMLLPSRYQLMSSLRVVGLRQPYASTPSPCPVPRPMPRLRELAVEGCRVPCWADVVTRAPALRALTVRPVFGVLTYRGHLESCLDLMARAPCWELTRLELRGDGPVLWGGSAQMQPPHPTAEAHEAMCRMPPARLACLQELAVTGRQLCPAVDAPVRAVTLEDPDDPAASMVARLGPLAKPTLARLTWSLPSAGLSLLGALHGLPALRDLDLAVRDVWHASVCAAATHALAGLPAGLTRLGLAFDMWRMAGLDPEVRWDVAPLAHLHALRELSVTLSFPTRGCERLVTGLLGAPPTLRLARVRAEQGPTWPQRAELLDLAVNPEFDDPGVVEDLEVEIEEIEAACRLRDDCLAAAQARFPDAVLEVAGFEFA